MKIYLFYITYDNSLYAYTTCKKIAIDFKNARSEDVFKMKTINLDKYEAMAFQSKYNHEKLIRDILYDGNRYYDIIITQQESDHLSMVCEEIDKNMDYIHNHDMYKNINDKYLKVIMTLTNTITKWDSQIPTLNVNTFKLFYDMYKYTFIKDSKNYINYDNS